ncbi:MAG: serine/threonine protein kinase [Deltaproteobacteria bacterium]|nr:serine/threonine protein kinase [Deltaproteobacteria bacterium]
MAVREMALATIVWAKEASTNVFVKMGKGLLKIAFVQRNAKRIGVGLLIWVVACMVGYLALRKAVEGLEHRLYEVGLSQTRTLAKKTRSSLLENDVLSLNRAIGEVSAGDELIFAAILDHQNRIVAHTHSELVDQIISPLEHVKQLGNVDGVSIGKAYLTLSGSSLHASAKKYGTLYVIGVVSCLLVLLAILVALDRLSAAKALKTEKDFQELAKIGPYTLEKKLAVGGMAELFVATYERQDGFRKTVAVKRVLPQFAEDPEFVAMFIREARLAALLGHPNVVQVMDFGNIGNAYFLAMEYVRGKNLAEIMAALKKSLSIDQAVFIVSGVAMGLEYSHSKKDEKSGKPLAIVHRDISPQNILVSFQGEVKISDYGISKAASETPLTQAGVVKGKLCYMSPEQALGQTVDHQTDIYALGIVFYEILSGGRLYQVTGELQALKTIPGMEVRPIKELNPDVPDELNQIVMKCLEKDKASRYQNAQELVDDLIDFRSSASITYDSITLSKFMKRHFRED